MGQPLLYEINTRCWLRELSQQSDAPITLENVPDSEFESWRGRGFTHIWLMGVWTTGEHARAEALKNADLLQAYQKLLPDWKPDDVLGSPYAIADYRVAKQLGGDEGLAAFRQRLRKAGMKLILDFVPNHLALDHDWVVNRPELFVQSAEATPDTFRVETAGGVRWLAHGKDPYFPGWTDTVQLDYRRTDTREAMLGLLQSVAARCDGVRCDMAMLLLNDVFAKTWSHLPVRGGPAAGRSEFWPEAIAEVKRAQPGFFFLAEVYWGLDGYMQTLGFDFTYDKHLYDKLMERAAGEAQQHLVRATTKYTRASAHFLENHDEPPIASRLPFAEHRAAALLILGLPGMRFLHEGQLTGYRFHIPVQLGRRPVLPSNREIAAYYDKLLEVLRKSAVGRGTDRILTPRRAWADNPTSDNIIVIQWQLHSQEFELVVVNLAPHRSQCYVPLQVEKIASCDWRMCDLLGEECYERYGQDLAQGLYLDLPAHAAQLFRFQPHEIRR